MNPRRELIIRCMTLPMLAVTMCLVFIYINLNLIILKHTYASYLDALLAVMSSANFEFFYIVSLIFL